MEHWDAKWQYFYWFSFGDGQMSLFASGDQ